MAKQKGIIKLEGTIGDITFYKSPDGFLAKGKGGIPAARIADCRCGWRCTPAAELVGDGG